MDDTHNSIQHTATPRRKPRILIVEDDSLIAWDMAVALEDAGCEIIGIVSDGAAALIQTTTSHPDVVLMDVHIAGDRDGVETARAFGERGTGPAIIFVTGYRDPETAERIRKFNPDGYLLKPVMPEELEAAVIRVLEARAAADE